MAELKSDRQEQTHGSELSPEQPGPVPRRCMWGFMILGVIVGLEINVQNLIAGQQTCLLLAFVGAAFGRAIDYFQAGRIQRGTGCLLPPALLIVSIGFAIFCHPTSRSSKPKLPQVDAPEVTSLVIQLVKDSLEVAEMREENGDLKLVDVAEISFDEDTQKRIARALLSTKLGTENIYYSVEWHDRENAMILVQVTDKP